LFSFHRPDLRLTPTIYFPDDILISGLDFLRHIRYIRHYSWDLCPSSQDV
jgi:hypothetical protein